MFYKSISLFGDIKIISIIIKVLVFSEEIKQVIKYKTFVIIGTIFRKTD